MTPIHAALAARDTARQAFDFADPRNRHEVDAAIHRLAAAEAQVMAVIEGERRARGMPGLGARARCAR